MNGSRKFDMQLMEEKDSKARTKIAICEIPPREINGVETKESVQNLD